VGNSYHALGEKEFSGYLGNAMSSGADVLLVLNFGANTLDLLRQAASFGIKKKMAVVVAWFSGLDTFQALGADVTEDMYFGVQYWHATDAPANREFVRLYRAEYNHTPRFISAADYQVATLVMDAVRRAGSTDGLAVVKALEDHTYQGLTGDEQVRAFDHQVVKNYLLLKAKKKAAMKDADDFADVVYASRAVVTRGESDCRMGA
jgi:branched-chain amino acid transport system substrate-binding protein